MTTVGLLASTWRSGAHYLRLVHEGAEARDETVETVLVTVTAPADPKGRAERVAAAARELTAGPVDVLALCSPVLHSDLADVRRATSTPVLHVADAVAQAVGAEGWTRLLLLGSSRATEGSGCLPRLGSHGLAPFLPDVAEQALVDEALRVVAGTRGETEMHSDEVREQLRRIVTRAVFRGAEAVVHLSPAVGLLLGEERPALPVVDAATVHAQAVVTAALGTSPVAAREPVSS